MTMKLYAGGLDHSVTKQELAAIFTAYGTVTSAIGIMDRDSGQ